MAAEALARAEVPPWCDPLRIALALGRSVRAVMRAEVRAALVHDCIDYVWVPNERETGLNIFMGNALAVFDDAGVTNPNAADVSRLAGYLALPDVGVTPEVELRVQVHAPEWFLREHQRRRRWAKWTASGVFSAVAARV